MDNLYIFGYMAYCYGLSFIIFKMKENYNINLIVMLKWDSESDLAMH